MVVFRLFLFILFAILSAQSLAVAAPINLNSDFSAGLTGWSSSGDVSVMSGAAVISDPNAGGSLLQSTNIGAGSYTLTFDLFNGLAPKGNPGFSQNVFADLAAGTLYFSNTTLTEVTLAGNSFTTLFDANSLGVTSALQNASLGNGWFQYTWAFQTAFSHVTTVFDLFDQDFVTNSNLKIDNVILSRVNSEIPEPASVLLLGAALPIIRRRVRG